MTPGSALIRPSSSGTGRNLRRAVCGATKVKRKTLRRTTVDELKLHDEESPRSPALKAAASPTTSRPTSKTASEAAVDAASDMESNADSDAEYLAERFGSLLSIGADSLEALAGQIRKSPRSDAYQGHCQLISRLNGSYNLVHILEFTDGMKYVIRVPITAQEGRFDENAQRELRAHALTLQYIKKKTELPVPDVFDFDVTHQNEIGFPYIAMSYLEGTQVSKKWFSHDLGLGNLRCRALDTIAEAMCKLKDLEFDAIGSLQFSNAYDLKDFEIGPYYDWDEGNPNDEDYGLATVIKPYGPFTSSRDYLKSFIEDDFLAGETFPVVIGSRILVSWMIDYLPLSTSTSNATDHETFVLCPPDYDSQNFLIDDEGNLTGILDWDVVQTVPRYIGYACYPGWITRDWDPLMYNHPSEIENTPEELEGFRVQWDNKMRELLGSGGDYRFTSKSHIFGNVVIAAQDPRCRSHIVCKILSAILEEDEVDCDSLIQELGEGELDPDIEKTIRDGIQELFSI